MAEKMKKEREDRVFDKSLSVVRFLGSCLHVCLCVIRVGVGYWVGSRGVFHRGRFPPFFAVTIKVHRQCVSNSGS